MSTNKNWKKALTLGLAMVWLAGYEAKAQLTRHLVDGISGAQFTLTARPGYISTADGNSVYFWGMSSGNGDPQYPSPSLVLTQGQTVTITLANELPVPVSLVFPGQGDVTSVGGVQGAITREVLPNGVPVTYTFLATNAGTFTYYSGSQTKLSTEMGLVGAIVVRPANGAGQALNTRAYASATTGFDHEFLFLLTDMDESIHIAVERQAQAHQPISVDMSMRQAVYWFINGRTGPDTMLGAGAQSPWLPNQPYDAFPMFYAGDRVLMRVIGGGLDPHPFHHHGNHAHIIAKDGRLLTTSTSTATGNGAPTPDLAEEVFTTTSTPGSTSDALFQWTGTGLDWDIYGHTAGEALKPFEDAAAHGRPIPVNLPTDQNLTLGSLWGGSPYIGQPGTLPPGDVGYNPSGGYAYMWHSHNEKEIVNNNVFPGGMMTMALILGRP